MATRPESQIAHAGGLRDQITRAVDRVRALATQARNALGRLFARRPQNVRAVLPLLFGAAIALAAGVAFLQLGQQMREGELVEYDDAVLLWVAEHRQPALNKFFLAITALGSWPVIALLTIGVCIGTLLAGERRLPTTLALAMIGAPPLTTCSRSV